MARAQNIFSYHCGIYVDNIFVVGCSNISWALAIILSNAIIKMCFIYSKLLKKFVIYHSYYLLIFLSLLYFLRKFRISSIHIRNDWFSEYMWWEINFVSRVSSPKDDKPFNLSMKLSCPNNIGDSLFRQFLLWYC